jgi:hypothetical protein
MRCRSNGSVENAHCCPLGCLCRGCCFEPAKHHLQHARIFVCAMRFWIMMFATQACAAFRMGLVGLLAIAQEILH